MKIIYLILLVVFLLPFSGFSQFVENKGQVVDHDQNFHPEVKYYHSSSNAGVYFQSDRVVYNLVKIDEVDKSLYSDNQFAYKEALSNRKATYYRMDLVFQNANSNIDISTGEKTQGVTHFYLNKRNGIRDVKTFKSIQYNEVYPNVDIVFHTSEKGMKYDIVLKEGADIEDVQLKFEGSNVRVVDNKLVIPTKFGDITEEIPLSFINDDSENEVDVEYVLNEDGSIGFNLKDDIGYTKLTIDPVLEWASYFNQVIDPTGFSNTLDYISNHIDDDGNYFTYGQGYSGAGNYPVVDPGGAYTDVYDNSSDVYIVKFNTDRQLVWGTYLGGSSGDKTSWGRPMTTQGNLLHIVGEDITAGAPFTNGGGFYENVDNRSFWARFNKNTGALQHLTSLSNGYQPSIAVSPLGRVAIISDNYGGSSTWYMPIMNRAGAYNQAVNGGSKDMGLLMFDASFNQIWGTFLGGPSPNEYFTCTFDSNDNLFFSGATSWFSSSTAANEQLVNLPGAYNQNTPGGAIDVKFGKFNANGQLVWHSLYGGSVDEGRAAQMGVPAKVNIHPTTGELIMAFSTTSSDLGVQNLTGAWNQGVPADTDFGAGGSFWNYAGYIAKFSTTGARNWATYFYSNTNNSGTYLQSIGFGGCNKFYVGAAGTDNTLTGATSGYNLLTNTSTSRSGYVTMLDANTFAFEWDSYLNSDNALDCYIASNVNQARFFTVGPIRNNNSPVVDPGNGAYYEANNWGATESTLGIYQFHPSLPPDLTNETICQGASVTLTASGGMGAPYNWYSSSTSSTILNTGSTYTVSPSSTTTYYVSSGTGMCASPRSAVTVTVTPGPTAPTISSNSPVCEGDAINLTANTISGATYSWTGPNSFSSSLEDPTLSPVTAAMAGTYNCEVTVSGCTSTAATTTVVVNANSTAPTSITGTSSICSGNSTTLTVSGGNLGTGATVQWYQGSCGGTFINTGNSITVAPTGTTTYYVRYSGTCNTTSCISQAVTVTAPPSAGSLSGNQNICAGATTTFTSTQAGGSWSSSNTGVATVNGSGVVTGVSGGTATITYTVNGTGGCPNATVTRTVTVNSNPSVTVPNSGNVCEGGTLNLSPSTGGTWSSSDPSVATITNGGVVTGVTAGTAEMTFTNSTTGCSSTASAGTITVNSLPTFTVSTIDPTSCGATDGTITISGLNASTNYEVSIASGAFSSETSDGSGEIVLTGLGSGSYSPIEVSLNNCSTIDNGTYDLNDPSSPTITVPNGGVVCEGDILNLTPTTGGTWSSSNTSVATITNGGVLTGVSGGTATMTFTDGTTGCSSVASAGTITVNSSPTVTVPNSGNVCEGGTLNLSPSTGGTWSSSDPSVATITNGGVVTGVTQGTADMTYTETSTGCSSTGSAGTITVNPLPTFTISLTDPSSCGATDGTITISGLNASTNYEVSIASGAFSSETSDGSGEIVLTGLGSGSYSPIEVSLNNCSIIDNGTYDLNDPSSPTITVPNGGELCEGEVLNVTPSTGGTWTSSDPGVATIDNSGVLTGISAGSATVTYTETATGCSSLASAGSITVNPIPTVTVPNGGNVCEGATLNLTPSTGGTWSSSDPGVATITNGGIVTGVSAGTAEMTFTNTTTGCSSVASTGAITVNSAPTITVPAENAICVGSTLNLEPSTGGTWTSTDPSVASITNAGLVTGISGGTADMVFTNTTTGCSSIASNGTVIVNTPPTLTTGVINCDKPSSSFSVEYTTSPGATVTSSVGNVTSTAVTNIPNDQEVIITATAQGCPSVQETVSTDECDDVVVDVSNGVSPNSDGMNDFLEITNLDAYPEHSLTIYNRWGDKVFESSPYENQWNGQNNVGGIGGEELPAGTYFYILELGEDEDPIKGYIELKR